MAEPAAANAGKGVLDGVTVLDFTHILSGPYCTMILGDMGATVIKVERLTGDDTRYSRLRLNDFSMQFGIVNRNKQSLAINLASPEGRDAIHRLAANSDVIVENFRPGTMDKFGLGYDEVAVGNPRVVYCSISGFGADSPERDRGGFDIIAQGMSGLLSVTGSPEFGVAKIGVPVADLTSGLYSVIAIVGALFRRFTTGRGEYIDVSLLDSAMALMVWEAAQLWSGGPIPGPMGTAHRNRTPYQAFTASDGDFVVGGGNESTWAALCRAMHREDLIADPRYKTNWDRLDHEKELIDELSAEFKKETVQHWVAALTAEGCPVGPVLNSAQAFDSEHAKLRNLKMESENPNGGSLYTIGFPYQTREAPPRVYLRPPTLGEHTRRVLADVAGLSPTEIDALVDKGIVKG